MADEKKKPAGPSLTPAEWLIVIFMGLALLSMILPMIWNYITSGEITFFGFHLSGLFDFIKRSVPFLKILGFTIGGFAAIFAFTWNKRADAVWVAEKTKIYPEEMLAPSTKAPPKNPMFEKWEAIVKHSQSENPSDWRVAIIEADIILDDLLNNLHLPGDTMGDKLKAVEPSDFTTIESAWEAHKARNMIAHEGNKFLLNPREVRRIISLYEAVFKEFYLI